MWKNVKKKENSRLTDNWKILYIEEIEPDENVVLDGFIPRELKECIKVSRIIPELN